MVTDDENLIMQKGKTRFTDWMIETIREMTKQWKVEEEKDLDEDYLRKFWNENNYQLKKESNSFKKSLCLC